VAPPEPDGDISLVVEAADGTRLATRRAVVVAGDASDAPTYFSAVMEVQGEPARISLLRGRQELGYVASEARPEPPRIVSHAEDARLVDDEALRWDPAGPEGTLYSVRYRSDPDAPPRVLAALTDATQVRIDLAVLP
ncbi:hypothetical protein SNE32_17200, partial [Lysobacter sp. D1-1-M9]|uniref:hypothetical protein n=1 Tax=Novilysobacter longmucuonensis TaxID=3098603 RepID=UPI002FCBC139